MDMKQMFESVDFAEKVISLYKESLGSEGQRLTDETVLKFIGVALAHKAAELRLDPETLLMESVGIADGEFIASLSSVVEKK